MSSIQAMSLRRSQAEGPTRSTSEGMHRHPARSIPDLRRGLLPAGSARKGPRVAAARRQPPARNNRGVDYRSGYSEVIQRRRAATVTALVPPPGSVVLNLVALYADPDFWAAVNAHQAEIAGFHDGIGAWRATQSEVVLELGSLGPAMVYSYGGYSANKEALVEC